MRYRSGKLMYLYTMSLGANNISVAKEIAYDAGLFLYITKYELLLFVLPPYSP